MAGRRIAMLLAGLLLAAAATSFAQRFGGEAGADRPGAA